MGPIIAVMFFMAVGALWIFLKFAPSNGSREQVRVFNIMVLGLAALMGTLWYAVWYVRLGHMDLMQHLPLIGLGGALGIAAAILIVFFLVRNFFVFRGESGRPGI